MGKEVIELDITVPNQTRYLGLIGRIGKELAGELEREGGGEELAHHLNTVLTEAMANAIRHAHEGDPEEKVHISIAIAEDEIRIRVFDHGRGFDLESVASDEPERLDEHGRGIFIIRCIMDRVVYRKLKEYNVLEMWKKLR